MDKKYNLTRTQNIYIYGYGRRGRGIATELVAQNYNVKGFIDKNAEKLQIQDGSSAIFSLHEIDLIEDKDNCVVIVSVESGMEHDKIAENLFKLGICKVLYAQMLVVTTYEERKSMRSNFKKVCEYCFDEVKEVPIYNINKSSWNNEKIISISNTGWIVFWCPISMIRVMDEGVLLDYVGAENGEIYKKYAGVRIIEFKPYLELYNWLNNKPADVEEYLKWVKRNTVELRESWLTSRKELYQIYEDAYRYDFSFFAEAPSICQWSEQGYFFMIDGMTRAQYLISKGYDCIPIVTTEKEYQIAKDKLGA